MAETITTKVLVLGGGPGGYVAAIRAGQLGLDTVLVEARPAGRHLPDPRLHPVQGADPRRRRSSRRMAQRPRKAATHGISLKAAPSSTWPRRCTGRRRVVDKLNGGVTGLLKRAKVRVVAGWGTLHRRQDLHREDRRRRGHHHRRARDSGRPARVPVALPFLPFGGT